LGGNYFIDIKFESPTVKDILSLFKNSKLVSVGNKALRKYKDTYIELFIPIITESFLKLLLKDMVRL